MEWDDRSKNSPPCIYLPASSETLPTRKEKVENKPIMGKGKILEMDDEKYIRDLVGERLFQRPHNG